MRIQRIQINNYRSIEEATIDGLGGVNVIIGKNNSGKSNLLSAINRFFLFVSHAETVASKRVVNILQRTDFHQKNQNEPVSISVLVSLDSEENREIVSSIHEEMPTVRNALSELGPEYQLELEVKYLPDPNPVGFISSVKIVTSEKTFSVLKVSQEAALEIAIREKSIDDHMQDARSYERVVRDFDESDFGIAKSGRNSSGYVLRKYARGSSKMASEIQRVFERSSNYEEFISDISDLSVSSRVKSEQEASQENDNMIVSFAGETGKVPNYVTRIMKILQRKTAHYLTEARDPIGGKEAGMILDLKVARGKSEQLRGIQSRVNELLGVNIDAYMESSFLPGGYGARSRIGRPEVGGAELDVDDFLVQINGSGIKESLRIILDGEFVEPCILMIEEPEVHLHPALESSVFQYLKSISSRTQVFLTTHSTNFLDNPNFENVYMTRGGKPTVVTKINSSEVEREVPEELGIRLSSLFMYDTLVFVEGLTDESVIRAFARSEGINLGQKSAGFIHIQGSRNFSYFAASDTMDFLTKRRTNIIFVIDRDEKSDEEVRDLSSRLEGLGEVHVLGRREIENYLVNAEAVHEYLTSERGVNAELVEVVEAINNSCEDLKEVCITKRISKKALKPLYPGVVEGKNGDIDQFLGLVNDELDKVAGKIDKIKESLESDVNAIKQEVEDCWSRDKLIVIPGEELLSAVFRQFGIAFNKKRDTIGLAEYVAAREVHEDMRKVLGSISGGINSKWSLGRV